MCNLYAIMEARAEIARLARAMTDRNNNNPPMTGVYPDYPAPVIVANEDGSREMRNMRWGLPSPAWVGQKNAKDRAAKLKAKGKDYDWEELLRMEPDLGITNVRKTEIDHWQRWMGPKNRCLVPMTSFSEPDQVGGSRKFHWFALDESRPLAFFAGVWTPHACVRKAKTGWEEIEAYGFMTTDARQPVLTYHDKAQPVILTTPDECDLWLSDKPWPEVKHLQRPLPDGVLQVVATDGRQDAVLPVR
jgi:putative SOS response-associated peptidase YedK